MNAPHVAGVIRTKGKSDVEKIFQHFFSHKNLFSTIPHTPWSPPTDVYETSDSYVIRLEIPGIENVDQDVTVEQAENVLAIRGYRRDKCSDIKLSFHQMEIHYGYFERVVTLPHSVEPNSRDGEYKDGFLTIIIKKGARRRGRRIDIKS